MSRPHNKDIARAVSAPRRAKHLGLHIRAPPKGSSGFVPLAQLDELRTVGIGRVEDGDAHDPGFVEGRPDDADAVVAGDVRLALVEQPGTQPESVEEPDRRRGLGADFV